MSEYVNTLGGWVSTCSTTSAEFTDVRLSYGETKNKEEGILMYRPDSSKSEYVTVSTLINFYNSLSTV